MSSSQNLPRLPHCGHPRIPARKRHHPAGGPGRLPVPRALPQPHEAGRFDADRARLGGRQGAQKRTLLRRIGHAGRDPARYFHANPLPQGAGNPQGRSPAARQRGRWCHRQHQNPDQACPKAVCKASRATPTTCRPACWKRTTSSSRCATRSSARTGCPNSCNAPTTAGSRRCCYDRLCAVPGTGRPSPSGKAKNCA